MSLLLHRIGEPAVLKGVVPVSPIERDQRDLRAILSDCHAPSQPARTMEDTLRCLLRGPIPLIVCDRDLPDGNWKLLFQQTETLPCPPRFIVSSRLADEYLWVEVLNLGGQDVPRTPFVACGAPAIKRRDVHREAWPGTVEHLMDGSMPANHPIPERRSYEPGSGPS